MGVFKRDTSSDVSTRTKKYNLASWVAQNDWSPICMKRAKGCYFWDENEKRYLDWSSQLINVNVGHCHPHVVKSIQSAAKQMTFAAPYFTTDVRAKAAEMLAEITPSNHHKSFFTLGGADANENAMKIARMYTGRQKILTRYRGYHGSTFGAASAGGDPRRIPNEPGVPWIIRMHDPYAYRNPIYRGKTQEEGDALLIAQIEETIIFEGPHTIAAIMLEGYSGSSGAFTGSSVYWDGIQALCDKYDMLLIVDEVLSGFGRTGKWFGFEWHPTLQPDIIAMAKGITSAYVPMGAVSVSDTIAEHFDHNTLWAGLTYSAHPLGCAAAVAVLEVMHKEGLVERAANTGVILKNGLQQLAAKHACVGEARGTGLLHVLELVKNQKSREALSPFHQSPTEPLKKIKSFLLKNGLSTLVRWNFLFSFPPLIVSKEQIEEGLGILDAALDIGDEYVEG